MPALDQATAKTPTLKLPNKGDRIAGTLFYVDNSRDAYDIDGNPVFWDDGTPKKTKIVWLIVNEASDGAVLSTTDEPPQAGDQGAIFVEGGTWVEWKNASETYSKGLETGTQVAWEYVRDEPAKNPKYYARKIRAFTFTDATAATRAAADIAYNAKLEEVNDQKRTALDIPEHEEPF